MEELTFKQKETLEAIVQFRLTHGVSPSIRDLMKIHGLTSPAPVQSRLERLKSKGYINWIDGAARSIRVLQVADSTKVAAFRTRKLLEAASLEEVAIALANALPGDKLMRLFSLAQLHQEQRVEALSA